MDVKAPIDPLRIQFLLHRLEDEFPQLPPAILTQAVLYVERDCQPDEALEAYGLRIREAVRKLAAHSLVKA